MSADPDWNDLAFWFPKIKKAGLPVPRTEIVSAVGMRLTDLLDGKDPDGWEDFIHDLRIDVMRMGVPCFLRTGHGSGKHQWRDTCFVTDAGLLEHHVGALVEWSALAGIMGLPTGTWVVRELIPTDPICVCEGYGGMPVTREFRFFANQYAVTHWQPYWPLGAVEEGRPGREGWRDDLRRISQLSKGEERMLGSMAIAAAGACGGGEWSADFLLDSHGKWWLTDMAVGQDSFRYDPEEA